MAYGDSAAASPSARGTPSFEDRTSANTAAEFVRCASRRRQCSGIGATTSAPSARQPLAAHSAKSAAHRERQRIAFGVLHPQQNLLQFGRRTIRARSSHRTTSSAHGNDNNQPSSLTPVTVRVRAMSSGIANGTGAPHARTSARQRSPSARGTSRTDRHVACRHRVLVQLRIAAHAARRKHQFATPRAETAQPAVKSVDQRVSPRASRTRQRLAQSASPALLQYDRLSS